MALLGNPGVRPAVLDAARSAIIPLRPLTVGEILDAALLVVQRNARQMVGLPLLMAAATAAWLAVGVSLWFALGNSTSSGARLVVVVLVGLLGALGLVLCLVWVTALLSRTTLQTALGEGFAPQATGWRSALPIFGPMLGLAALQYVALQVLSLVVGLLLDLLLALGLAVGGDAFLVGYLFASALCFVVFALGYGYLSMTVPALANEAAQAPAWLGKPAKSTNPLTAFQRSVTLIGWRQAGRVLAVFAGAFAVILAVLLLVAAGLYAVVLVFAQSLSQHAAALLTDPWVIFGVVGCSVVVAMSGVLAFLAGVQTLLYLDLRMRREGLDLALRFDCVPVPQPAAPPVRSWPVPVGTPPAPPR